MALVCCVFYLVCVFVQRPSECTRILNAEGGVLKNAIEVRFFQPLVITRRAIVAVTATAYYLACYCCGDWYRLLLSRLLLLLAITRRAIVAVTGTGCCSLGFLLLLLVAVSATGCCSLGFLLLLLLAVCFADLSHVVFQTSQGRRHRCSCRREQTIRHLPGIPAKLLEVFRFLWPAVLLLLPLQEEGIVCWSILFSKPECSATVLEQLPSSADLASSDAMFLGVPAACLSRRSAA